MKVQDEEGAGARRTTASASFRAAGDAPGAVGPVSEQAVKVNAAPATITPRDNRVISASLDGGEESACGWCKDKWGLSWQITPIALTQAITDPDPAAAKRAFDAMMEMKNIDIAKIEAARRG